MGINNAVETDDISSRLQGAFPLLYAGSAESGVQEQLDIPSARMGQSAFLGLVLITAREVAAVNGEDYSDSVSDLAP